ncbi:MAG: PIG-L family deacetylase [Flavobacteriales bacterium]|nr:PIG-L family deacetylase [Flavobacteriales bacterium]
MFKKILYFLFYLPVCLNAQSVKNYSSSRILLEINKFKTCASVLYIAAHPDDENTRLIAYLENELKVRTAYLSLTRGDGGQNLIGPEQGVDLGLIRSQELLAARSVDGAEQFFTRAYDFGYSKNPDETFDNWNKDSILSDVVWVIRKFKPDLIITRFGSNGSGGHGHHTASAILAEEAFEAAADPKRFSWQLKYVDTWKTQRLFYNSTARFRNPEADMSGLLKVDVGGYNSLLGLSYGEIAALSRSMHKSQGFGSARQRGENFEYFEQLKGSKKAENSLFDAVDVSWKRYGKGEIIEQLVSKVIADFDINHPDASLKKLYEIQNQMIRLGFDKSLPHKYEELLEIQKLCTGLFIDVTASEPYLPLGSEGRLRFEFINRTETPVVIDSLRLPGCYKGLSEHNMFDTTVNLKLNPNQPVILTINVKPVFQQENKTFAQPYWLEEVPDGVFKIKDKTKIGMPESEFYNSVLITGKLGQSAKFSSEYSIKYKWVEPDKGELYRPAVITPPVIIHFDENVKVFTNSEPREITVNLKSMVENLEGTLHLNLPSNWRSEPSQQSFKLSNRNQEIRLSFLITPPDNDNEAELKAEVRLLNKTYTNDLKEIKYDHIPVQNWFPAAEVKMLNLKLNKKKVKIGYLPGAGDKVAECLEQIGYQVRILDLNDIANGNLKEYPTLITGVRAFNTHRELIQYKNKLMEYVAQGGNLIIQYNTNSWAGPLKETIGPLPFNITRTRVTDENATAIFLEPEHKVLNTPNKITSEDFKGWIQERGIYFAGDIDSSYQCPLGFSDKGEEIEKGSLLILPYGKGHYSYTGLVFFRELPAGVPGAFRLITNLIEM